MRCLDLEGPSVQDEGVVIPVQENDVQNVQGVDGRDARNQCAFTMAVKGLQGKTACIDFAAFFHEFDDLVVEVLMAWKRFISKLWKTTLNAQCDAWTVEENGSLKAFTLESGGL